MSLLFQAVVLENDKREDAETAVSFLFYLTCSTNIVRHEKLGQLLCLESTDTMSSKLDNEGWHLSDDSNVLFLVKMYRVILIPMYFHFIVELICEK